MRARRLLLPVLAVLVLAATTACVRLPENGPVVPADTQGEAPVGAGLDYVPKRPREGDPPSAIVEGFLRAMTATPVNTTVARTFLTTDAQTSWDPEERTILFDGRGALTGQTVVSVGLRGVEWVDAQGAWRGRLGGGTRELSFPMTTENGEWRIAAAPNALVVDELWFQENFRQANVYFFDPTANILVPEPVFVQSGRQLASALLQALLAGPGERLLDVSRTFIPAGLTLGLSVPVSGTGVADITLKGEAQQITDQAAQLMVDQIAWTLRQDPTVTAFRVTVGDQPVTLEGGESQFSVDLGSEVAPAAVLASPLLFALRDGRLESGDESALAPVAGRFGTTTFGIRSVGVSLTASQVAAVSSSGTSILLGPVTDDGPVDTVVSEASDLLPPAWDFADRMWLVDRTPAGARVSYRERGAQLPITVPGLTRRDVKSFLVSRDGSRLVAVVHGKRTDRLVVSRIRHDAQGRVLGATRARAIAWNGADIQRIRGIGWRSATSVAVLHLLTKAISQVVSISVDGAPSSTGTRPLTQRQRVRYLVASPAPDEALYTVSDVEDGVGLYDLTGLAGGNLGLSLAGVTSLKYVG